MTTSFSVAALVAAQTACRGLIQSHPDEDALAVGAQPWQLSHCLWRHEEVEVGVLCNESTVIAIVGKMCGCNISQVEVNGHSSLATGRLTSDCKKEIASALVRQLQELDSVASLIVFIKEESG